MSTIELKIATLSLLPGNIVSIRFKEYSILSLPNAEELLDGILKLNPNIGPRLIFYNKDMSFDFEAVRFLSKSKKANAIAIVNENKKSLHTLNALLAMFTMMKSNYKIKFFNNEQDAKDWLLQFIQTS